MEATNEISSQNPSAPNKPEKQRSGQKNLSKLAAIICAILALGGIGFGAYEFFQNGQKAAENAKLRAYVDLLKLETDTDLVEEGNKTYVKFKVPSSFFLQGMDIKIKNLPTPHHYAYQLGTTPADPVSSITISYSSKVTPKLADGTLLGIDSLPIFDIATIYAYMEDDLFANNNSCDLDIGRIGSLNLCIDKLGYPEEFALYDAEVKTAWQEAFDETSNAIFEVLSSPSNYYSLSN